MSDGFIAKFVNSEIATKGGTAEPLDVTIGKKEDVASSVNTSSMFSWIKDVWSFVSTINSRLTANRALYLDYLAHSTYGLSAINTKVASLTTVGTIKTVRSVQRGTHAGNSSSGTGETGITISAVAPEKCSITIYPSYALTRDSIEFATPSTSRDIRLPYVINLTSTQLLLSRSSESISSGTYWRGLPFSWEIVEYY